MLVVVIHEEIESACLFDEKRVHANWMFEISNQPKARIIVFPSFWMSVWSITRQCETLGKLPNTRFIHLSNVKLERVLLVSWNSFSLSTIALCVELAFEINSYSLTNTVNDRHCYLLNFNVFFAFHCSYLLRVREIFNYNRILTRSSNF